MKVTQTQIASSAMILVNILVLRKIASCKLVELKTSLRMMMLSDVAAIERLAQSIEVVVQFAAQIVNVLLLLEMGEQPIEADRDAR